MVEPSPKPEPAEPSTRSQIIGVFARLVDAAVDPKILLIVCATFLGWVYLMPEDRRHEAKVSDFLSILVGGEGVWQLATVALSVLLLISWLLGGVAVLVLRRRLEAVGHELSTLRTHRDPARLSSKDPASLAAYAKRSKIAFPAKVKR